jgi:hypothetical protein
MQPPSTGIMCVAVEMAWDVYEKSNCEILVEGGKECDRPQPIGIHGHKLTKDNLYKGNTGV